MKTMRDASMRLVLALILFTLPLGLVGCPSGGPGGSGGGGGGGSNPPPTERTEDALSGQVSSLSGDPIAGAKVTLDNGRSMSTDANGFFSFEGLSAGERVVARFEADGFAPTVKGLTVGTGSPACVLMAPAAATVTLDADTSSTQRSGDSAVTLTGGSLVDANGQPVSGSVDLTATFLDPSTEGVMAFPGSFDEAQATGGADTSLESFGFAIYELSQDGEPVNLAPGSTAEIEYVLPDNAQNRFQVGDRIPLWEFDEETATWKEAGEGEVRLASDGSGRLAWFATVDHFSAWNCDAPLEEKHCLTGRVLFEGSPVGGAIVSAVGVDYNGVSDATTGSDGRFCVDVKRSSTVRVEVRLNGSAIPVLTREVTVPDVIADCATGGCLDIGDLDVTLDACVSGQVRDSDGNPLGGVTVHIVPGETVVSDSDGMFCGATIPDATVYVFAEGRPSTTVTTGGAGSCGEGACATADIALTFPGDGDQVGQISAGLERSLVGGSLDTTSFSVAASFVLADAAALSEAGVSGPSGFEVTVESVEGCTVTTMETTVTVSDETDLSTLPATFGLGALDAGPSGTASGATATVDLLPDDPNRTDPPSPFLAGFYRPEESSDELLALGFGAGQTVRIAFPGGADLGAFEAVVDVPPEVEVLTPDLTAADLTLDLGAALDLAWVAGDAGDTVVVTITSSSFLPIPNPDGTLTASGTTVSVECRFPDTGSGTVPAAAMGSLPTDDPLATTTLSVSRTREGEASVPLRRVAGSGKVHLIGRAGVTRAFIPLPEVPDIPDLSDLCSLIPCPAGTVCNPDTLTCDPQ